MRSYRTRMMLDQATWITAILNTVDDILQAHYAAVRDLYDEPTISEEYVEAKMRGDV